jgi:hypothetical protein
MECRLLWVLALHLCLMPWALGTMNPASQIASLVLSVLGIWFALAPREIRMAGGGGKAMPSLWPKLVMFPLFWLGIVFLFYVFLQGINPSWRFESDPAYWWLRRIPNIGWLPTGIEAPFERFNVWRQWIIYADVWLLVCTVWVGLTRRRSLRILLAVMTANGVALGALLAWEQLGHAVKAPKFADLPGFSELIAAFPYKNNAGAFFSLMVFSAIALATWYFDLGQRRQLKSTPSGLWGLAAVLLTVALVFTLSRGAVLALGSSLVCYGLWLALRRIRRPAMSDSNPARTVTVALVFIVVAALSVRSLDFSGITERFSALATEKANEFSVATRLQARSAAVDMLKDAGVRGIGAGSFRYLFPEYVRHYPRIYNGGKWVWEHAHCDWLEIPIELGLAGDLLLLGGLGWGVAWFARRKFVWHPLGVPLLLGCLATVLHAGFDYPFQCPAILATWAVFIAIAGRWVDLETKS